MRWRTIKPKHVLVAVLLAVLGAVAYLLYDDMAKTAGDLTQKIGERQRAVNSVRSVFNRKDQLERRLAEVEELLRDLKTQVEGGSQYPSFLTYLEESATRARVVVTGLAFQKPEPIMIPQAATPSKTADPAQTKGAPGAPAAGTKAGAAPAAGGSGQPPNPAPGTPAKSPAPGATPGQPPPAPAAVKSPYVRYPVTLTAIGSYPGAEELIGRLEQALPLVTVESVDLATWPGESTKTGEAPRKDQPPPPAKTSPPPAGAEKAASIPQGWVRMELKLSIIADADGSSQWAQELSNLVQGQGRRNPFEGVTTAAPNSGAR